MSHKPTINVVAVLVVVARDCAAGVLDVMASVPSDVPTNDVVLVCELVSTIVVVPACELRNKDDVVAVFKVVSTFSNVPNFEVMRDGDVPDLDVVSTFGVVPGFESVNNDCVVPALDVPSTFDVVPAFEVMNNEGVSVLEMVFTFDVVPAFEVIINDGVVSVLEVVSIDRVDSMPLNWILPWMLCLQKFYFDYMNMSKQFVNLLIHRIIQ